MLQTSNPQLFAISPHDFSMVLTVNPVSIPPNKIIDCSLQGDSLWQRAANGTDIYYSNGNVGVGTNAPATKLSVEGDTLTYNKATLQLEK